MSVVVLMTNEVALS